MEKLNPNRYQTDAKIKQEFINFLDWINEIEDNPELNSVEKVEQYFIEKNIALYCSNGELRKLHGANTRDSKKELLFVIVASIIGLSIGIIISLI